MRLIAAAASLVLLLGCGAADRTVAARDDNDNQSHLIDVNPALNICPHFEGSFVLPQSIPSDSPAFVAARAVDPDANDLELKYSWSATSGEFTTPERAITEYRCDKLGEQTLTIVATDTAHCDTELHLDVTCLSP